MRATGSELTNLIEPRLLLGFTNLPELRERAPLRIVSGRGVFIYDDTGKDYIEAVSSFYCTALGFSEGELVEAAARQMREMPFYVSAAGCTLPVVEALAEKLCVMAPIDNAKIAFAATGSEANDALVKFSWFRNIATGEPARRKMIARYGSYHGGTVATASLTGWSKYHAGFGLPLDGFLHVSQPDYYNLGEAGESEAAFVDRMVGEVAALIEREGPETIAGFIAEPVSVAAGLVLPPEGYFEKLQAILGSCGICFFADEVVTGFCRTGKLFGSETYGLASDCMTVAKALSSAYQPISALIMSEDFYAGLERGSAEVGMFSHAGTYHGHPVAAAVALRALELMEERDILSHVQNIAPVFERHLRAFADHPLVGDCRSVGLAGAVELVRNRESRRRAAPAGALGRQFAERARANGLFVRATGDSVVLSPPLIIQEAEIDELFRRFSVAMAETADWAMREWGPA